MKKFILIILLIPHYVLASTIYTNYEPFKLNVDEYLEENEILKREELKVYNTYLEELEEYYLSVDEFSKEYKIDYNDYIFEDRKTLESNEYSYDYQSLCLNDNYKIKNLYITFNNELEISEARINTKSETFAYNIGVKNFQGFMPSISDKDYFGSTLKVNKNSQISFGFYKEIDLENITLNLYFPKQLLNDISFKIILNNEIELIGNFILPNEKNNTITINFDNNYYDFLKLHNLLTENKCISYFSSKVPLYKHSKINLIPLNNYIPLNNESLFLLDDFKIKYNYYKRNKIVVKDNLVLDNEIFNINNYILSSTIPIEKLKIIHNINYEQEGIYNLKLYYENELLITQDIHYLKEKNEKKIINKQMTTKNVITKRLTQTTTVSSSNVNKINNEIITSVKGNKYQKSILITIISLILILLIIFECTLLYVKKKYY